MRTTVILIAAVFLQINCTNSANIKDNDLLFEGEQNFENINQLTFGGENAEAYFSGDEKKLIFQSTRKPFTADQIFSMNIDGSDVRLLSTGKGRTTCAYYLPDDSRIVYASTHLGGDDPPEPIIYKNGKYVWPIYETYDVFSALPDGNDLQRLTDTNGYDAEATIAPDGSKIVFTSVRDDDLELYTMDPDGSNQKRLTNVIGYDGGAFYSFDSKKIVYRAYHPDDREEIRVYKGFLDQGLVQPTQLDIYVMDDDGTNRIQVTDNGKANFAPFFHPDGKRIIFSSNLDSEDERNFDLYIINIDGTGLKRLTFNPSFDGFPMFTRDGKKLVFASNRNANVEGETNIFITDFIER